MPYINPRHCTKETWLSDFGTVTQPHYPPPPDKALICWVDNGPFAAAGVCFCRAEYEAFAAPDPRLKFWYLVPREIVAPVCKSFPKFEDTSNELKWDY